MRLRTLLFSGLLRAALGALVLRTENELDIDPAGGKSILIRVTARPPAGAILRRGSVLDPYCSAVDEDDLALSAFGPMSIL
jgi:hypothetical protein